MAAGWAANATPMLKTVPATVGQIMQRTFTPLLRGASIAQPALTELPPMNGLFGRHEGTLATEPGGQQQRHYWQNGRRRADRSGIR